MAIAGNYGIEIKTPMGNLTGKLALTVDCNSLSGICSTSRGNHPISGTLISDREVTFSTKVNSPLGQINITGTGTINGDEIAGHVKAGSFGSFPFKGKKE